MSDPERTARTPQEKLASFLNSCDKCGKENAENVLCDDCARSSGQSDWIAEAKEFIRRYLRNFECDHYRKRKTCLVCIAKQLAESAKGE